MTPPPVRRSVLIFRNETICLTEANSRASQRQASGAANSRAHIPAIADSGCVMTAMRWLVGGPLLAAAGMGVMWGEASFGGRTG